MSAQRNYQRTLRGLHVSLTVGAGTRPYQWQLADQAGALMESELTEYATLVDAVQDLFAAGILTRYEEACAMHRVLKRILNSLKDAAADRP